MKTTPEKLSPQRARFVEPGLRPSSEQPSGRRIAVAVGCIISGFVAAGVGAAPVVWWLLVIGFALAAVGALLLCPSALRRLPSRKMTTFESCMDTTRPN